jgi:hypothetical protein
MELLKYFILLQCLYRVNVLRTFCYAVPHNLQKSLVLVFFHVLVMEI